MENVIKHYVLDQIYTKTHTLTFKSIVYFSECPLVNMPRKGDRGILGFKKDPKNQILFSFSACKGGEWPSDDSDDSDYMPGDELDSEVIGQVNNHK